MYSTVEMQLRAPPSEVVGVRGKFWSSQAPSTHRMPLTVQEVDNNCLTMSYLRIDPRQACSRLLFTLCGLPRGHL